MNNILTSLFPYRLHLHVLQLEEYELTRFWNWISTHFFIRNDEDKKPLVWTQKARGIYLISFALILLTLCVFTYLWGILGFIISLLFSTQAYLFLSLAYLMLTPLDGYLKNKAKKALKEKLAKQKELKIIGITGSFGKTSTKVFLYHILKAKSTVLKTPESYNTMLGIAKVVDLELYPEYEYFLCEMGAYKRGDIREIAETVHVDIAMLTGLNEQHLERYGSVDNAIKGEFELIDTIDKNTPAFINGDNMLIKQSYQQYDKNYITYGLTDTKNTIKDIHTTEHGTRFSLMLKGYEIKAETSLLGKAHLTNILGAATVAYYLNVPLETIVDQIKTLKAAAHRLEVKEQPGFTLIDDAFSSNSDGFSVALDVLSEFSNKKVLVTPGIIELGTQTEEVHIRLGKKASTICDSIILVGRNVRTKALAEGIEDKSKILYIENIKDVWAKIKELGYDHPVVLLENDLPDTY